MRLNRLTYTLIFTLLAAACSKEKFPAVQTTDDIILVGGVETDYMEVRQETKAAAEQDAETIDWLQGPLKEGLDISYGNLFFNADGSRVEKNKHVAILKLKTDTQGNIEYSTFEENGVQKQLAVYSFEYKKTEGGVTQGNPAKWYDNGPHFFEGVYVPSQLRQNSQSRPADLTADQSGDNYTYLTRYLAMPADCQISATISRIKLPLKHRLARVLAYVLIDPEMHPANGNRITIRGYDTGTTGQDDPRTSEIRFDKVNVLDYVKEDVSGTLTPVWKNEVRKVIPHFVGENGGIKPDGSFISGNFVMYHHKKHDTYIAPSNDEYADAKADFERNGTSSQYEQIVYENVPCYDLIVEPSYTDRDNVVYDEEGFYNADGSVNEVNRKKWADTKNKIHFEVTLSNGLKYEKEFQFNDLDANYQTVVYLRIKRESVDYDSSGSDKWIGSDGSDGYYGLDNQNGYSLSKAGSSWQRAFRVSDSNPVGSEGYTDGDAYLGKQNLTEEQWKNAFLDATENGVHKGDYFVLDGDMSIDIPDDFVFMGHLDAKGHTLTLSKTLGGLDGDYDADPGKFNVHTEGSYLVPLKGYRAELLNCKFRISGATSLFKDGAEVTGHIKNCSLNGTKIADVVPEAKY